MPDADFPGSVFDRRGQFAVAVAFLTRLPVRVAADVPQDALARSVWAFPLVGAGVGLIAGLVGVVALMLRLPPGAAACLALAAGALVTGALHEDGLADTADGLGGGITVERRLEIMKDSRIGTYGVLALGLVLLAKFACLGRMAHFGGGHLVLALVAAHAAGRAIIPWLMSRLEPVRPGGLAAGVGRVAQPEALIALGIGWALAVIVLGPVRGTLALAAALGAAAVQGALARRAIGGYTGDILGAAEQLGEVTVLLVAVAAI